MDLSAAVQTIKGVGPKTAQTLEKAGLYTVRDLLYTLPRDYENFQAATSIQALKPGKVIIKGKISNLATRYTRRRNFNITEGTITDATGAVKAVWYNQPYRKTAFKEEQEYYFSGNFDFKFGHYQLISPSATAATEVDGATHAFQPIYKAHGRLNSQYFKKLFTGLRSAFADIPDLLPLDGAPDFIKKSSRADALYQVHFPESETEVEQGRKYLAYEELFELLLAAQLNRQEASQLQATPLPFSATRTKQLTASLPFKLTNAQRAAAWEILQDLERPTPMNRLLQGDVGSGKTVVAALAAHQTAMSGHQTALLAPTAILAEQHYQSLTKLLKPQKMRVILLTGATKDKEKLKKQIKEGKYDLIVGTHALLTDDTLFASLALCIIDEQHRFGVEQRQKLLAKTALTTPGKSPHFLAMTATPIPRSLQLTVFGDLDVSIIGEFPKGRQPIETTILPEIQLEADLYPVLRTHLAAGEQAYWICREIGEEDGGDTSEGLGGGSAEPERRGPVTTGAANASRRSTTSVVHQAKRLQKLFPEFKVAYLHGRLRPAEKDQIMQDFAEHKIDLLVSTTVVEVGVDVPNATQIVIQDAEHYGLAQLHQLRGRVGRGTKPSRCYLLTEADAQPSQRLKELQKSTDGFHLAEVDLKLRGPGEIYGNLQHGALDLRIASLADTHLIKLAKSQAEAFAKTPQNMVKYPELASTIQKYQQLTTLN